jgi:hypothetical protein
VKPAPAQAVWLAENARPILLRYLHPDSCIESSALALDFLRRLGIACRELPVEVSVMNEPAWRLYEGGSTYGASPEERAAWDLAGAWGVGLGMISTPVPRPDQYAGHLIVVVEGGWLLDLSLDQASRPRHGIVVAPLLAAIPGGLHHGTAFETAGGVRLVYRPSRTLWAKTYRTAPGWTSSARRAALLGEVLAAYESEAAQ